MRISCSMFLLDLDDDLYCLPSSGFERMLRDPRKHPLRGFAGSRVRMSEVAVEVVEKKPVRVVWSTFDMLAFDAQGRFDAAAYARHQRACAVLGLVPPLAKSALSAPGFAELARAGSVVEAAGRFVAQGGCWIPSRPLLRRIGAAALGLLKCKRLQP